MHRIVLGMDTLRNTRIFVVAGPPASGKGTQCKKLAQKFGLVHLSIGDIVRDESNRGTELGLFVKGFMDRGDFVPDDAICSVVMDRVSQPDVVHHGCLLDGFPRTFEQALLFVKQVEVVVFMQLVVPDDIVVVRALGRRNDHETGAIYHLEFIPPNPEILPRLVRRDNDANEEIVRKRLEVYHSQIQQIVSCFPGKVHVIDGTKAPDEVCDVVGAKVHELLNAARVAPKGDPKEDDWGDEEVEASVELSLEIEPCEDLGSEGVECHVVVSITVPEYNSSMPALAGSRSGHTERAPADVCCVIDISGSMCSAVKCEIEGAERNDGLNRLDIAKHAVKVVMNVLKAEDRCAIVAFDDVAETIFPLQYMTADGRESAVVVLDALRHRARTNIWAGIHTAMEALRCPSEDIGWRQKTVLLLTDGEPTVLPANGHLPELRHYKESHPNFNFQLNTFGFGYELDSKLLLDLAVEGAGTFAFIPDGAIVGTCFVNSLANSLSTQTHKATLHISAQGGAEITGPAVGVGENMVTDASWGHVVSLGPLQYGQRRDVVVLMRVPGGTTPYLEAVVVYPKKHGEGDVRASAQASLRTATPKAILAMARSKVVKLGSKVVEMDCPSLSRESMLALGTEIETYELSFGGVATELAGLRIDVTGRMSKALDGEERFNRWGKHYLRALTRAHQLQLCTNFMDTGLQVYGGQLFRALREEGDATFVSLPPPKPSNKRPSPQRTTTTASVAAPYTAPVADSGPDMQDYYAGSGGG